jgi:hypothetical protein
MKQFFLDLWTLHGLIGKVCDLFLVTIFLVALIGIPFGITHFLIRDAVVGTNYFLGESAPLHDANYLVRVLEVWSSSSVAIISKDGSFAVKEGNFVNAKLRVGQNAESMLKDHEFDCDDFKLKDHTGMYVPMGDILEAVGWDGIDIHFDESAGGHVMSSADFPTKKAIKDYSFVGTKVGAGEAFSFSVSFAMEEGYQVEDELMVLECDFYIGSIGYKQGTDIVLLPRPASL